MKSFSVRIASSLAASALVSVGMLWGQSPSSKSSKNANRSNIDDSNTTERSLRVDNLIAMAQSAPPEVAVDLLLTLASSELIIKKERKRELIEQAFQIAEKVREPVRRKSWGLIVDTRSGLKQAAFDLELDKLSAQSKAVGQMIALDRLRAKQMFEDITLPPMKPLTCEDSLGYVLDSYYRAMLSVAEQCFDADERKAGIHIQFLSARLGNVKSVAQVTPALRILSDAKQSPDELSLLVNVLTEALGRVSGDARSFAFAIERDRLISTADGLISKLKEHDVPTNEFGRAVRSFLIKNMSGEVCADVTWLKDGQPSVPPDLAARTNEFATPINADDLRPSTVGPPAPEVIFWKTPKAAALLKSAKSLRFGGGTKELSPEQRETDEWHQKLVDFLQLLASWEPESEPSSADYFQERCIMYYVLVDLCPNDAQRDVVLRAYGNYLKETNGEYKGRIGWILPVKTYLRVLRAKSDAVRRMSLDPWLTSSDESLRIYAELALLTSPKS